MTENVLITGATGFIGRHLVERLSGEDVNIIVISRNVEAFKGNQQVECVCGNLNDVEKIVITLKKYDISTCFHLAWEGIPDFSFENCQRNMKYGLNVLEMCKKLGIKKLLVSGSCLEYKRANGFVSETDDLDKNSLFAVTKNTLYDFSHVFCRENGMKLYWLRLFYVIGVGQRSGSVLPYLIKCILNGKTPVLKTPYDANDFVCVDDVADAFAVFWRENPSQEVYNIGTGKLTMTEELSAMVREAYYEEKTNECEKQVPISRFGANCEAVLKDTSWKPSRTINEIVLEMVNQSRKNNEELIT